MSRALFVVLAVVLAFDAAGCVHGHGAIAPKQGGGYENYPTTLEAEHARRARRRRHALIAAPIEIVAGTALTALALYAPMTRDDDGDGSVTDALGDGAKEIAGRALLAGLGTSLALSGVGDGLLGLSGPAFRSPLVRGGRLVPAGEIDAIDPPRTPLLNFHAGQVLSTRGIGSDAGLGLTHWIAPRVRLRESASLEWELAWRGDRDLHWMVGGDVVLERAFGRAHLGLFPTSAIGVYAGGGWRFTDGRGAARAGFTATLRGQQLHLGATWLPGAERLPAIELGFRHELRTD